jgi:hypothetical protein
MEPRLHHVDCLSPAGFHRMAISMGRRANPRVLICARADAMGRDFDRLARAMADRRVVCRMSLAAVSVTGCDPRFTRYRSTRRTWWR